jgi:pimeloyl-ACP methyl ester carboxylesterase
MFSTVVRYNMRGAHNSVAKRNFNLFSVLTSPDPDSEDLVAVCDFVLEKLPSPPQELFLIGYSYGATVAASALQQVPQVGLVSSCAELALDTAAGVRQTGTAGGRRSIYRLGLQH